MQSGRSWGLFAVLGGLGRQASVYSLSRHDFRQRQLAQASIQGGPRAAISGCGGPRVAGARVGREGGGDGVECGEAVVGGGVEVAADAAPAGEGAVGVPVAGDGLVPFGGLGARSEQLFVHSTAGSRVNSQTWSA